MQQQPACGGDVQDWCESAQKPRAGGLGGAGRFVLQREREEVTAIRGAALGGRGSVSHLNPFEPFWRSRPIPLAQPLRLARAGRQA
jgi:hypothetical protein